MFRPMLSSTLGCLYTTVCVANDYVLVLFANSVVFPVPLSRELEFDPGVFVRFDLAALVRPHLSFFCLFVIYCHSLDSHHPNAMCCGSQS